MIKIKKYHTIFKECFFHFEQADNLVVDLLNLTKSHAVVKLSIV